MLAKRPSRPFARAKFALALPLAAGLMLLFSFRLVDTLPAAAPLRQALAAAAQYAATLSEVTIAAEKPAPVPPAEPEPTPYIFYWGQFQCSILHHPDNDTYVGSVSVTPTVFRSSIQREPRLWDGSQRTMMASCQMRLGQLRLRSDYGSPDAYTATLKGLNEYAYTLMPGETLWLSELTLPNGKTATLEVQLAGSPDGRNGPNPGLIFNNSTGGMKLDSNRPAHKHWGAAIWDYASTHDFITVQQFWALVKQSPLFFASEEELEEGRRSLFILPAPALTLS
ncbi:MAG TPA: hypothetical protein PK858_13040, partial [Saprospiraceae bacterium]|nr:hypothetical protein [Saprospiraceae bacterium]